ncbi:response regulator transcription factor [Novosphingobium sp. PASSN1]|uniref:response regulator transcription factor n=1 Tax=Novosphingobium sp. PASSN1 TaxID=2015561 RepID=UPI0025E72529|nr:response regulator transcription factor [Novosphingobium sp. PASSN1]
MSAFPARFCIVDDDSEFVEFLADYLRARGADALGFQSAEAFIESGRVAEFDFFIFDLNLGRIDGVDLIALIRAQTNKGILIVSGRMGPDAFNSALAAGADMFINKPVRFDQIYHAVASVARRTGVDKVKQDSPWMFDPEEGRLTSPEGAEVAISPLETRILATLYAAGTAPVPRAQFLDFSSDTQGAHRNLDAAIFRLRRKVEAETGTRPPFRTVHAVGFQMVAPMALKSSLKSGQ